MNLALTADAGVALLLVITIYYAAKLSRRLRMLRADKAELQALVESLATTAQSAEAGVKAFRAGAEEIGRSIEGKVQAAQTLRDDLAYMLERGVVIADRLEGSLRGRREEPRPEAVRARPVEAPRPAPASQPKHEARPGPANFIQEMAARLAPNAPSRSERDLLRALAGRR
jgi:hypothetical protein